MKLGISVINKNKSLNLLNIKTNFTFHKKLKNHIKNTLEVLKLQKEINYMHQRWIRLMADAGANNSEMKTYTLCNMREERYGWSSEIYAPFNLPLENLEKLKAAIEGTFYCKFIFRISDDNRVARAKFIFRSEGNKITFSPVKVKPFQLYMGVDASCSPIIFDQNIDCHVLVVGNTRKGKSMAIHHALISLICSCTPQEVELILVQMIKDDLGIYEDCEQVSCYCNTLEKTVAALEYAVNQINVRTELMKPLRRKGLVSNITEYNEQVSEDKQLSRIIVTIDEWGAFIPEPHDSQEVKNLKNSCSSYLCTVSQAGASVGITYVIGEQRPTADRIPPFLKNNSNVRIAFGVSTKKGSEVCLDNDMAFMLPPRRAVYYCNGEYDMLYTTNLSTPRMYELIKPHIRRHITLFDKLNMPEEQYHAEYTGEQQAIQGEEPVLTIQYIKKKTRRGGGKKKIDN